MYLLDEKITVVLPAHNAEETLSAAVLSILNQTYTNFELWILENGSTDKTLQVARQFLYDPRVRVFELGPTGFQGALEFALREADTNWIARMDADDISFPKRFEKQMKFLINNPEYVFVGTSFVVMTPFNHIFIQRKKRNSRQVKQKSFVNGGEDSWFFADASVVFHRGKAIEAGGYDPEFKMGDQPLWFRLLEIGKGYEIAEPLYVYRSSAISMNFGIYHNEVIAVRRKYFKVNNIDKPFDWKKRNNKFWSKVAFQELIAGSGVNVRVALKNLEGSNVRRRRLKLWFLSFFAELLAIYYRISQRGDYEHIPELERELLNSENK